MTTRRPSHRAAAAMTAAASTAERPGGIGAGMPGARHPAGDAGEGGGATARLWTWGPLAVLVVFGLAAVVGFAVFGRSPARLAGLSDAALRFYGMSFGFFGRGQVLLAGLVLMVELVRRTGWRWVPAFVALYAISLGSELMGTAYGVPFGPYEYTDLLGVRWLGLVPALIPLSWFYMAVPSYALARAALDRPDQAARSGGWAGRIAMGSLLLLAWDLSLDPAMSEATPYWVWGEAGPYYGMPLMNLVGWYVTGVVLMGALEWLGGRSWIPALSVKWLAVFYGANLLVSVGMSVAGGLWGAAVATVVLLGGVVVWTSSRSRSSRTSQEAAW
jgi:uncharacterized membrane protein